MTELKVGDPIWFYATGHNGEMTKGEFIGTIDRNGNSLYVIAVPRPPVDEDYEVRDWNTISLDGKSINFFKKMKETS